MSRYVNEMRTRDQLSVDAGVDISSIEIYFLITPPQLRGDWEQEQEQEWTETSAFRSVPYNLQLRLQHWRNSVQNWRLFRANRIQIVLYRRTEWRRSRLSVRYRPEGNFYFNLNWLLLLNYLLLLSNQRCRVVPQYHLLTVPFANRTHPRKNKKTFCKRRRVPFV